MTISIRTRRMSSWWTRTGSWLQHCRRCVVGLGVGVDRGLVVGTDPLARLVAVITEATVAWLAHRYERLLRRAVDDPDARLAALTAG